MVFLSVTKNRDHEKPYLFPQTSAFWKSESQFDIGMPFFWWKGHNDSHFLERLYERTQDEFCAYYDHHLQFFLKETEEVTEIEYFSHVNDIVSDELGKLIADDKRESKSKHKSIVQQKKMLRTFLEHLTSIDQWNVSRTKDEILAEKESEIKELKEIVVQLIKEARKLETDGLLISPKATF